jgi:predicted nucleic acid-binding Zn ribbon protein
MPLYTYRREDGTTFDYRQGFNDEPLTTDPQTGAPVVRIVQAAGIIFKGSGFYVNDSKGKTQSTLNNSSKAEKTDAATTPASETKSESKSESKTDASAAATPAPAAAPAASATTTSTKTE